MVPYVYSLSYEKNVGLELLIQTSCHCRPSRGVLIYGRTYPRDSQLKTQLNSHKSRALSTMNVQSKPVIRDLKGLADFVPYLGYPLLPTLIFSDKSRQFHNVNNNFMNDKDKTPMTMIELSTYNINTTIQVHNIPYIEVPYSEVQM